MTRATLLIGFQHGNRNLQSQSQSRQRCRRSFTTTTVAPCKTTTETGAKSKISAPRPKINTWDTLIPDRSLKGMFYFAKGEMTAYGKGIFKIGKEVLSARRLLNAKGMSWGMKDWGKYVNTGLTRDEFLFLALAHKNFRTLAPIVLWFALPFVGYLIPFVAIEHPTMLPDPMLNDKKREVSAALSLEKKRETVAVYQASVSSLPTGELPESYLALTFPGKLKLGDLDDSEVQALCIMYSLTPKYFIALNRVELSQHMTYLSVDDLYLKNLNLDDLEDTALIKAAGERGFDSLDPQLCSKYLRDWLTVAESSTEVALALYPLYVWKEPEAPIPALEL